MIKFGILTSCLILSINSHGQSNYASVKVHCTDNNNNALQGEQVVFIKANSNTQVKGITDNNGFFTTELQGPGKYFIKAESIGQSVDAGSVVLPILKSGQSYGKYEVEIRIEPERTFTLDNVFYESGKANLKKESFAELNELLELLTNKMKLKVEIAGHTDDVGSNQSNLELSKSRAESVKTYLVQKGIEAGRIKTVGYGESRPIADNSTSEGRKINRRTEVRILN